MEEIKITNEDVKKIVQDAVEDIAKTSKTELEKTSELMKSLEQISKRFEVGELAKKELMHTDPAVAMATLLKGMKTKDKELINQVYGKAHDPNDVQTDADGGYLVPAVTMPVIKQLIATYNQGLQLCQVMPLATTNVVYIPAKLTGATSYVVAEEASITSTKPTLTRLTLTPTKFATLGAITNELMLSANPAIGSYLIDLFAQSQGTLLDARIFQDGSTTWNGICLASATYGKSQLTSGVSATTLTYQDLVEAAYGVDQAYLVGASWIMSRSVAAIVRGLLDLNNRPVFEPAQNGMPASILGYPVNIVENCPTAPTTASKTVCMLGNWKNSVIGDVNNLRIAMSDSATIDSDSAFQYDFTALRMTKHWAFSAGMILGYSQIETAAA